MSRLSDYIFHHKHYKLIQNCYTEATQTLVQAYNIWKSTVTYNFADDYATKVFVYQNIDNIRQINDWIQTTNILLGTRRQAVSWLFFDTYGSPIIPDLSYKEYKFIAENHNSINIYYGLISTYKSIVNDYKDAVVRFLGIETSNHDFEQIRKIANSKFEIIKIYNTLNKAISCSIDYYRAWKVFSNGRHIKDIPLSELDSIDPDHFQTKNHFLWLFNKNQILSELIIGSKSHPFSSFNKDVIEREEDLTFILNSSLKEPILETTFNIHLSDDKQLKETILDSSLFGIRCNFNESFTIDKFYPYRAKFDNLNIPFDKALSFLEENEEAIKDYNNNRCGKRVSFIEDYYRCIDNTSNLYSYILSYKEQQEIKQKFIDQILTNPIRCKYYKSFLVDIEATNESAEKYCITHLIELDDYINRFVHSQYVTLKVQYPYGVDYCEKFEHPYGYSNEEAVVEFKDKLQQWDRAYKKYKSLENRYPIGISAFERFNSYDDGKNSAGLTIEEIIECESDIARFQEIGNRYQQTLHLEGPDLIRRICLFARLSNAIENWDNIKGIPYYFFYHYYPTRFNDISSESEKARRLIWNFKDGITTNTVSNLLSNKLKETFSNYELSELTLVCIPASTIDANIERYQTFSKTVCSATGMKNGFTKIQITKEKTPAHLSANHVSEPAEYYFDSSFFKGAKVILFDDVVTKGRSMAQFKQYLEDIGADVICAISIGRTYSDYYGEHRTPHPYSGIL